MSDPIVRAAVTAELASIYKALHYGSGHMGLNAHKVLADRRDEILRQLGCKNP